MKFCSLAITPDGSLLAAGQTGQANGKLYNDIEIVDVKRARLLARLKGHHDTITLLEFSDNGARLQSKSKLDEVKFWNTSALLSGARNSIIGPSYLTALDCRCLITFPSHLSVSRLSSGVILFFDLLQPERSFLSTARGTKVMVVRRPKLQLGGHCQKYRQG